MNKKIKKPSTISKALKEPDTKKIEVKSVKLELPHDDYNELKYHAGKEKLTISEMLIELIRKHIVRQMIP